MVFKFCSFYHLFNKNVQIYFIIRKTNNSISYIKIYVVSTNIITYLEINKTDMVKLFYISLINDF
ncbi:hypothetical protein PFFVO_03113 [Plasmodium falciparum Vietnam Oak-Knoll (FVO)]|uniref:Uncharacterized protein n=1 Tax=Plasmodium falciparum Vietnam Oak-Knoll (FVO) TaxID=1036723 RepID=A0A024V5Z6_PLAFA|nr:hypothetical protein PFFVO_03113 [Plasmodium falciparum Vietnam Oak-Knoll (FVO)]